MPFNRVSSNCNLSSSPPLLTLANVCFVLCLNFITSVLCNIFCFRSFQFWNFHRMCHSLIIKYNLLFGVIFAILAGFLFTLNNGLIKMFHLNYTDVIFVRSVLQVGCFAGVIFVNRLDLIPLNNYIGLEIRTSIRTAWADSKYYSTRLHLLE